MHINSIFKTLIAVTVALWCQIAASSPTVETQWLADHQSDKDVIIVDMDDETQYQRFHLPGAINLPYEILELQKRGSFPTPIDNQTVVTLLGKIGITSSDHVVIYDDMGGLNAGRLFWHLERIGHNKVSILNGGLVKWILENRKVVNTGVKPTAVNYGKMGPIRDNIADLSQVITASTDKNTVILDVRTDQEYNGNKRNRSGHVPNAQWWPWEQSVDFINGFVIQQNSTLESSLAKVSVAKKDQPIIAYCQSGHRAAQTYFTLRNLGYTQVKLYANSMNEYLRQPSAPLNIGQQP